MPVFVGMVPDPWMSKAAVRVDESRVRRAGTETGRVRPGPVLVAQPVEAGASCGDVTSAVLSFATPNPIMAFASSPAHVAARSA